MSCYESISITALFLQYGFFASFTVLEASSTRYSCYALDWQIDDILDIGFVLEAVF